MESKEFEQETPEEFQFKWEPKDGLKMLSESWFQLALQMAAAGIVCVEPELTEYGEVCIDIADDFTYEVEQGETPIPTCVLAADTENMRGSAEFNMGNKICTRSDSTLFKSFKGQPIDSCVFYFAGYIRYLLQNDLAELIEEDRAWYEENKKEIEWEYKTPEYSFGLSPELFMDAPDDMLTLAELLQERNYVSLSKGRVSDKDSASYNMIYLAADVEMGDEDPAGLTKRILSGDVFHSPIRQFPISVNTRFDNCMYGSVHLQLAAYVDYLRQMGQYESFKEKREAYRKQTDEEFQVILDEHPSFKNVPSLVNKKTDSSLYCVIEGNRGGWKQQIVDLIASVLIQCGKVYPSMVMDVTFEQLANQLAYTRQGRGASPEDLYMEYDDLRQRTLYILTDIKEFIYRSRNAEDGDDSREAHLIKLLGRYQPQTYIIIVGEKKYIDQFLELTPQIGLLFGNNVVTVQDLSPEALYGLYTRKLSAELRQQAKANPGFQKTFLEYIKANREQLPLDNRELADYLADYAKERDELVLPSSTYRSADEMLASVVDRDSLKVVIQDFRENLEYHMQSQQQGMQLPDGYMHMVFEGNAGTGKTMIADVIDQILFEAGMIDKSPVTEIVFQDLLLITEEESVAHTEKILDHAPDGVVLIKGIYEAEDSDVSRAVMAVLTRAMEEDRDRLLFIFTGPAEEMQAFLGHYPGLYSRIGYILRFADYSTEDLLNIFDEKIKDAGFEYDPGTFTEPLTNLFGQYMIREGFDNGHFVDRLVQRVISAHAKNARPDEDPTKLTAEDIPTAQQMEDVSYKGQLNYEDQLSEFVGMEPVKQKVRQFAKYIKVEQEAKKAGAREPVKNMHMIFTGNPGTGKTSIARLMADLLFSVGVLKTNKFKEVERKDLVAEYAGHTEQKTSKVIESALGGVLFIDEAYALAHDQYGAEAMEILITAMENHKNDLVVIFAGYREEMRKFVDSNPGIASRIGYTFDFDDYTPKELTTMFMNKMARSNYKVNESAKKKVTQDLEYFVKKKNFGNGRFVDRLIQETLMKHAENMPDEVTSTNSELLVIDGKDIPEVQDLTDTVKRPKAKDQMESVVGLKKVKDKMAEFDVYMKFCKDARNSGFTVPDANMHMAFLGNPGTGKTMMARIVADKLFEIGLIKENKIKEVGRRDLEAEYVGQTGPQTQKVIEDALGGVLFIDEAYELASDLGTDHGYAEQVITTLVDAMDKHRDDLVVIFAGYKDEMEKFINSNPGLKSRIGFTFEFDDYTPEELTDIFDRKFTDCRYSLEEGVDPKVLKLMGEAVKVKNFGNGRFVESAVQKTLMNHAGSYDAQNIGIISETDIPTFEEMKDFMADTESDKKVGFTV